MPPFQAHTPPHGLILLLTIVLCVAPVMGVPIIVEFSDSAAMTAAVHTYANYHAVPIDPDLHFVAMDVPRDLVSLISIDSTVKVLEEDHSMTAAADSAKLGLVPYISRHHEVTNVPWGVKMIHADVPLVRGKDGSGVRVLLLDGGIDCLHPALTRSIAEGCNFLDPDNKKDLSSRSPHGTHCAGIIVARRSDPNAYGIAPGVRLYIGKILAVSEDGQLTGHVSTLIRALSWAKSENIQLVSMSFGMQKQSWALNKALDDAYHKNILLIAASGNDGTLISDYPARHTHVMSVGAVNQSGLHYMSSKSKVDICAPGENIISTVPGGGYGEMSGSSMATPYVTGVAALVMKEHPDWSPNRVMIHLKNTATYISTNPNVGAGLLNAEKSLAAAV